MSQIVCDNLVKIYKVADLEVVALQGLDLAVEPVVDVVPVVAVVPPVAVVPAVPPAVVVPPAVLPLGRSRPVTE